MYDMHYDLLTILYVYLSKTNKNYNPTQLAKILKEMYGTEYIKGGIINLYFTPLDEMMNELDITADECVNIKRMLKNSLNYLKKMQKEELVPKDFDYLVSIEGCDYISPEDLEELYKEYKLRSIIPVWNHCNQYGSGYKTEEGLTTLGKRLINEAIKLGIMIDVSHANQETFNDILDTFALNTNPNKTLIASHSNVRKLRDVRRNLTDEQLKRLNNLGGYIGLLSNSDFVFKEFRDKTFEYRIEKYFEHIDYLLKVIEYNPERIMMSTDNMNFDPDPSYHNKEAFKSSMIPIVKEKMAKKFGEKIANDIMEENAKKLIRRIK